MNPWDEEWQAPAAVVRARGWLRSHTLLFDAVLVVLLDVWVLGTMYHRGGDRGSWALLVSQLLVLPLVARRRHPWPVFLLLASVGALQWLSGVRLTADAALVIALYSTAAYGSRRRAVLAACVLEVGVVLASVRFAPTGDGVLASIVFLTGMVAAALFGGIAVRTRRQYLGALRERATRLEVERDQQARLAVTAERTRIARELHDVVAHSLSVIITLADAAALSRPEDAAQARETMAQVAATGRDSMTQMRKLLGVLREDATSPVELSPQPDLDHLDSLIDDVRALGLPVELTTTGSRPPLTATQQAAIYRIVQESLTNVIKHAPTPTTVRVALRWNDIRVSIDITDTAPPAEPGRSGRTSTGPGPAVNADRPRTGAGHGIVGMQERAALFGGTLDATPLASGGWRVHAELPIAPNR